MIKHWVGAARLRTLPLSISGIIVGTAVAAYQGKFDLWVFILAIFTTIGLQVLSNFANDYGDGIKGTDNEERIGPKRAIQSGVISTKAMKRGIIITSAVTLLLAILLIYVAFGSTNFGYTLFFFVLGLLAIAAAIKYTVGKSAYGYQGLGDVFVFVFFGLVSVVGSYFLYTKQLYLPIFLPAISIGLLSTAVLNLNNMRDRENDQRAQKNTLVVKLGEEKAKKYHYFLIYGAMSCFVIFTILNHSKLSHWIYIIIFSPLFKHLFFVKQNKVLQLFDPELKKVALSTFFISILFLIGLLVW